MNLAQTSEVLHEGHAYMVAIAGQSIRVRRIFKFRESRFGSIPCFVFTAKAPRGVTASYDKKAHSLTIRSDGCRLPVSEVSVPHYDIIEATPCA